MKKCIVATLIFLTLFCGVCQARHYSRIALVGTVGALDELGILKVNGPSGQNYDLNNGDSALVDIPPGGGADEVTTFTYIFDESGTDVQNLPYVVRPLDFDIVGAGVWRMAKGQFSEITVDIINILNNSNGVLMSLAEQAKLAGIEDGAQVNPPAATAQEITDGTETAARAVSPADLKLSAQTHATPAAESISYSPEVFTKWITQATPASGSWTSVAWSPALNLFAAVNYFGQVMTSPDGVTWTEQTSAASNQWQDIAWSPALGLFAAVATSGTGNRVMTSPDGVNWTAQASAADNDWSAIAWSPALGLFAAVASSGTGNRVMTSPDGVNWTTRASAEDNSWLDIAWSSELGLFAAVATTGTNRVMTSADGINWTARAAASLSYWNGIAWSAELGLFAAVANSGGNNRVMTSADGINWSLQACPSTNDWTDIAWSPELGIFAAVAFSGTEGNIMTSADGVTWTAQKSPADVLYRLRGITWSAELGVFAAVSYTQSEVVLGKKLLSITNGAENILDATTALDGILSEVDTSKGIRLITQSPYIVKPNDHVLIVDSNDHATVVYFLDAASDDAKRLTIKKIDLSSYAIQCEPRPGNTIEGESVTYDFVLPGESMTFVPDGVSAWHMIQ